MNKCKVCGRTLKNKDSIEKSIGPSCEKKMIKENIQITTLNDFKWANNT